MALRAISCALPILKCDSLVFWELRSHEEDDKEGKVASLLPSLQKGEFLQLLDLYPEQHFTEPPARYSEGTLVRL